MLSAGAAQGRPKPIAPAELRIDSLGACSYESPLTGHAFVADDARVLVDIDYHEGTPPAPIGFEKAGPRRLLRFDPAATKAAIVTCGGLCPGLNNVIRHAYYALTQTYGVPEVLGIRYGYLGLCPGEGPPPLRLTPEVVGSIHQDGGTLLGTSRGPRDPAVMVDFLQSEGVNVLLPIGGDGTQRGAHAIATEVARRGADLAVVGIPKTIDNDIGYCFQSFGFLTAVSEAERVIDRAHVEANSVQRGVGLVRLMGREAGFIAAAATVASGVVNFTIVPEQPLVLDGDDGFLARLGRRLDARGHAVVVVAEGAGQAFLEDDVPNARDVSGNRKFDDIGVYLRDRIVEHFQAAGRPIGMKYFDPSYYIRSLPAGAGDSLLTERFARHAVHAAMAGKTDVLVGFWNGRIVHVPLAVSTAHPRRLEPTSELWSAVRAITQQERW